MCTLVTGADCLAQPSDLAFEKQKATYSHTLISIYRGLRVVTLHRDHSGSCFSPSPCVLAFYHSSFAFSAPPHPPARLQICIKRGWGLRGPWFKGTRLLDNNQAKCLTLRTLHTHFGPSSLFFRDREKPVFDFGPTQMYYYPKLRIAQEDITKQSCGGR